MSEITATFRITIISLMIVAGAINTIAYKFQNKQMVFEGQFYKYFFHPYMQATTMFFGEALAFAVFYFMSKRDPETFNVRKMEAKSKGKEIEFNKFLLAIPAISDLITSTLQYVALNFVTGSVYQMMRGGSIVTTFLFSIVFLKIKAQKNQVAGSALALIGVLIVGTSSVVFTPQSSGSDYQIVGYILLITSLFTNGFQFVFEEKLLGKYHIEPLEMVGY
jgi:drug/metabolite transporter (DMT)-like permease